MTDPVWTVRISRGYKRDLYRLPPRVAGPIVEFVTSALPDNSLRLSKPLTGDLRGLRSARRGDYRVVFELNETVNVLVVLRVDHRAHVYRSE